MKVTAVTPNDSQPLYIRRSAATGRNGRYGIGPSWFSELVAAGILPKPIKLGPRFSVWERAILDAVFADPTLAKKIAEYSATRRALRASRRQVRAARGGT